MARGGAGVRRGRPPGPPRVARGRAVRISGSAPGSRASRPSLGSSGPRAPSPGAVLMVLRLLLLLGLLLPVVLPVGPVIAIAIASTPLESAPWKVSSATSAVVVRPPVASVVPPELAVVVLILPWVVPLPVVGRGARP